MHLKFWFMAFEQTSMNAQARNAGKLSGVLHGTISQPNLDNTE